MNYQPPSAPHGAPAPGEVHGMWMGWVVGTGGKGWEEGGFLGEERVAGRPRWVVVGGMGCDLALALAPMWTKLAATIKIATFPRVFVPVAGVQGWQG